MSETMSNNFFLPYSILRETLVAKRQRWQTHTELQANLANSVLDKGMFFIWLDRLRYRETETSH